ncbi:hypothetical protein CPLU01_11453 [Colletotrichum plurivorum]|uniref:Uncharacterized protein n=1 Tax=Colletotrichum plurivorum TaxID=2175906 RepID=A0A8H6K260_9PEZI|nr:hypothetical protein CPLU01_11453 [Colletotrichum plurivorum]
MTAKINDLIRRGFRTLGRETSLSHTDSPTYKTVWEEWKDVPESVIMELSPVPYEIGEDTQHISWTAELVLSTRDLPRLMREGLHWTAANVHPEMSVLDPEPELEKDKNKSRKKPKTMVRSYFISDLGKDCNWAGFLMVHARDEVLTQFRVSDLRPHMILRAIAWNTVYRSEFRGNSQKAGRSADPAEEVAYFYDSFDPKNNINVIYDDMPLEGRWPWPKKAFGEGDEGEAEKTETELSETAHRPFQPPPRGVTGFIRTFCSGLRCW